MAEGEVTSKGVIKNIELSGPSALALGRQSGSESGGFAASRPLTKTMREREQAVTETGKNILVSAGAGSGKTTLLVERFLYLVTEKKASPDRIVAITYTERAAGLLKERLAQAFSERGLFEERRALENAYIGTIHSFAARLLRENPLEAGCDPHFAVIEPGRAEILADEMLSEVLEEKAYQEGVFHLLRTFGEENISESLKAVSVKVRSSGVDLAGLLAQLPEPESGPLWKELEEAVRAFLSERPLPPNPPDSVATCSPSARALGPAGAAKTADANKQAAGALLERIPDGREALAWETIGELAAFEKRIKALGKQGAQVKRIRDLLGSAVGIEIQKTGAPFLATFLALHTLFQSRLDARKREDGQLDFDDLLIKAYRLFTSSGEISQALRRRYQQKFEFLLVDEFQDTNRLQARWIELLGRGDNLFVVGDAKQSIYRFRNADIEVFLEMDKGIAASAGGLRLSLPVNYRSRAELVRFVNGLFEEIWKEDGFPFEKLEAKRSFGPKPIPSVEILSVEKIQAAGSGTSSFAPDLQSQRKGVGAAGNKTSSLAAALQSQRKGAGGAEGEEGESMDEARIREARALARRLKEIVEGREIQVTERDGGVRDVAYGDIAILFRAMTGSAIYEHELKELDIPYYTVRGRDFYERREVVDLLDFLVLLNRPDLDIPLASVLRSPLVGLSEDALFWISRPKEKSREIPLWRGLDDNPFLGELTHEDAGKLAAFLRLYGELEAAKDRRKISETLSILVELTRYDAKILGRPEGKRKLANVRKLVDIAREFEAGTAFGLSDFVRYVKHLSLQEVRESEAQIELEKAEAVKLLTIHKAKGLEFPVVVVADLGGEPGPRSGLPFNLTEAFGLGFRIRNEFLGRPVESDAFRKNKEYEDEKESGELKRLFYVALTRAEDHLILSGVRRTREAGGRSYRDLATWMDWIHEALGASSSLRVPSTAGGSKRDEAISRDCFAGLMPSPQAVPEGAGAIDFQGIPVRVIEAGAAGLESSRFGAALPSQREGAGAAGNKTSSLAAALQSQRMSDGAGGGHVWPKPAALAEEAPFRQCIRDLASSDTGALSALTDQEDAERAKELLRRAAFARKDYFETRDLPVSAILKFEECPGCYFRAYEMRAPEEGAAGSETSSLAVPPGRRRDCEKPAVLPSQREGAGTAGPESSRFGVVLPSQREGAGTGGGEDLEDGQEAGDEVVLLSRREFGNLFHRLMEWLDFRGSPEDEIDQALAPWSALVPEPVLARLRECARNFMAGDCGRILKEAELYRELPFIYKLPRGQLRGQIDVLAKTSAGQWLVLDYKTGGVSGDAELQAKTAASALQISLYALALKEAGGIVPSQGILYFTAVDRAVRVDVSEKALAEAQRKAEAVFEAIANRTGPFAHKEGCRYSVRAEQV